ncbi:hypothetical protein EV702DRAFT_1252161 [Suillus placidus]|uniref:Uncharacterized protein n=1 Tax=Suillus placidus TaxID=48579 RepID=A0A9P7CWK2_9AGAM|nr:hypothetical protein EV702DRAFT_1252161 [Suillus placidus]
MIYDSRSNSNTTRLPEISGQLPYLITIQTLSVSPSFDLPENFWRVGSADFPELKVIHLNKGSIGGLITALRSKGTQNSDMAFPSLHALELKGIDFQYEEPESLQDVIAIRANNDASDGFHIHKLQFASCRNLYQQTGNTEEDTSEISVTIEVGCKSNQVIQQAPRPALHLINEVGAVILEQNVGKPVASGLRDVQ